MTPHFGRKCEEVASNMLQLRNKLVLGFAEKREEESRPARNAEWETSQVMRGDRFQCRTNLQQSFQILSAKYVKGVRMKMVEMKDVKRIPQTCTDRRARSLRDMTMQNENV